MPLLSSNRFSQTPGRFLWSGLRLAVFVPGLLAAWNLAAQPATPATTAGIAKEYQLKAVFLFNFSQFVSWPTNAFSEPNSPLVIGVLGTDPFGANLDAVVRGEKVNGHPLEVRRYSKVEEVGPCHILFISQSEASRLETILETLKGRNILTVSDVDQAARRGVMIRFATENNKIRLRINLAAAEAAGLTISSKLLRPATIVAGDNG